MLLKAKIEQDSILALKEKDQLKLSVLRLLKSAIKNSEIDKRGSGEETDLSDEDIIKVIKKEIKKREEAIENYQKAGNQSLADKEKNEKEILKEYLPEDLDEAEILNIINNIKNQNNLNSKEDFGKLMKLVMQELGVRADGKIVSQLVQKSFE